MALQLLLETSAGVSGLKSIETAGLFDGQRATMIMLPHSVVIINALSGVALHTFDFPKRDNVKIIDCVYIEESRCFLVAFSNSTLAVVLEGAKSTAGTVYVPWPQQPLKLLTLKERGVVVVCADSTVWHVSLKDCLLPLPLSTSQSGENYKNVLCLGACTSGESISIIRKNNTCHVAEIEEDVDAESEECSVLTWNVPQVAVGTCRILTENSATNSDFKIRKNEKLVNIVTHVGSRSVSVLFSSPCPFKIKLDNSCNTRWRKYDCCDGSLLFERIMGSVKKRKGDTGNNLINAVAVDGMLWLIFDGRAGLWDPRYGVELTNVPTYISNLDRGSHSSSLIFLDTAHTGSQTVYDFTTCVPHTDGCSIFHTALKVPAAETTGSLCNALGRLVTVKDSASGKYFVRGHIQTMRLSQTSIASKLTPQMQKHLQTAQKTMIFEYQMSLKNAKSSKKLATEAIEPISHYQSMPQNDKKRKFTPQEWTDRIRAQADPVLDLKGEPVLYLEIPIATVKCFLEHFEALAYNAYPQYLDWDAMLTLMHSGTVSTAKSGPNKHLLQQAIKGGRFDILAVACRYAPDLSERAAIQILLACAEAKERDLMRLYMDKFGNIRYRRPVKEVAEDMKKKKPRKKQASDQDAITTGQLITGMMESIIRRRVSYSTILLSDAMKKTITPSFCVILLRVVMLYLKGLCAPLTDPSAAHTEGSVNTLATHITNHLVTIFRCDSTHTGGGCKTYSDEHVQGAITWAEALLDSHFSSLAFRASFHAPTRRVLGEVMETVATASDASQEVERALGLWIHVDRVIRGGGGAQGPLNRPVPEGKS